MAGRQTGEAHELSPDSDFSVLSGIRALTSPSEWLHQTVRATWGVLKLPDAHSLSNLGHWSAQHKTDSSGRFKNKRLNACGLKNTKYLSLCHTQWHGHARKHFSLLYNSMKTRYMKKMIRIHGDEKRIHYSLHAIDKSKIYSVM